ncbi:MAG: aldehyde dehydrogenase family protein, partial [Actinomycetes bacterium]
MATAPNPIKVIDYQMYIGGAWVDAENGAVSEVVDPSTETVIARVPKATVGDAERAVRAAREAFD